MCVTCLAVSVLALFTPVPETPTVSTELATGSLVEQVRPVRSNSVAEDTRRSITAMLKRLPDSADTQILRQEFELLHGQLAEGTDDARADAIIDEWLNAFSQKVKAAPNGDQLIEALFELGEDRYNQQARLGSHSQLLSNILRGQTHQWGWLA